MEEVDSLMGRMRINPVSDIHEEFLEDDLLRLEGMKNDAEACLKLFMIRKRRYKGEMDATLKQQVEEEDYKLEMAAKKRTFQPNGPPPQAPMGCQDLLTHFQLEKKTGTGTCGPWRRPPPT